LFSCLFKFAEIFFYSFGYEHWITLFLGHNYISLQPTLYQ